MKISNLLPDSVLKGLTSLSYIYLCDIFCNAAIFMLTGNILEEHFWSKAVVFKGKEENEIVDVKETWKYKALYKYKVLIISINI